MNVRHAACEPCRRAKLACGHQRPTCHRCQSRGKEGQCVYRARPFRRRASQPQHNRGSSPQRPSTSPGVSSAPPTPVTSSASQEQGSPTQVHRYPNPGFLGTSSHATIFNQVSSCAAPDAPSSEPDDSHLRTPSSGADVLQDQRIAESAVNTLTCIKQQDITKLNALLNNWLDTGVNLALAEPFVARSREGALSLTGSTSMISHQAKMLVRNTQRSFSITPNMSLAEFFSQLLGNNLRWEMLGIYFTAATRAVLETFTFAPLYTTVEQRRLLIKALMYISDCCLEICLALDCLNDVQLVLQYENMVAHSQVDGDQSYHSWRKVGDVTSSLCALGYHEKIDENASRIPPYIAQLRKAAFARIYSADKNQAIFLENIPGIWQDSTWPERNQSAEVEMINYTADTRCSALFAYLKEDILQMLRNRQSQKTAENSSEIREKIEMQWQQLPPQFRLTTTLKDCNRNPFERDFLVATRLDYLHTLFLANLVSQKKTSEPDEALLMVASEMVSLTVQVIILRHNLTNAGTGLMWKVTLYGLPAAGILSLALLNSSANLNTPHLSRSRMVQDLSTLVAEVTIGEWIQPGEPNFALYMRATRTIQSLLDSLMAWRPHQGSTTTQDVVNTTNVDGWDPCINFQSWEFEMDFWASLAEHPTLLT